MTSTVEVSVQDIVDNDAREVIAGILDTGDRGVRVDASRLDAFTESGLVRVAKSAAAEIARLEAIQVRAVAVLARRRADRVSTAAEFALALKLTPGFAQAFVAAAEDLTARWPCTVEQMERGRLNLFRAMKVTAVTAWLSDEHARAADVRLAPRLADKDADGVRKAAAYVAQQVDPAGADRRARQRRDDRKLTLTHQDSGTATLTLDDAPVEKAVAAYTRVDRMAKALKTGAESRTLDQLRADVALDLLLAAEQAGPEPRMEGFLYLGLDTYLGLNDHPGHLAGHGTIPAGLAREILAGPNTVLRRILTDPRTGQVQELGRTRYRPSAEIREFVQVRDQTCRRPGCARPAQACDLDHTVDWQHGGGTDTANLGAFCGRDHGLKDRGWHYHLTEDATLVITTPAGQIYTSTPPALHEPRIPDSDHDDEEPPF